MISPNPYKPHLKGKSQPTITSTAISLGQAIIISPLLSLHSHFYSLQSILNPASWVIPLKHKSKPSSESSFPCGNNQNPFPFSESFPRWIHVMPCTAAHPASPTSDYYPLLTRHALNSPGMLMSQALCTGCSVPGTLLLQISSGSPCTFFKSLLKWSWPNYHHLPPTPSTLHLPYLALFPPIPYFKVYQGLLSVFP